jgi:hypothetical protein
MARDPRIPLDDMIVAMDRIAEAVGTLTFESSPQIGALSTLLNARS